MTVSTHLDDDPCRYVRALATAPTFTARRNVLRITLNAFDHYETHIHDTAAHGTPVVVCCLERAVRNEIVCETVSLCRLLTLMLRCSEAIAVQFLEKTLARLVSVLCLALNQVPHLKFDEDLSISTFNKAVCDLTEKVAAFEISLESAIHTSEIIQQFQRIIRNESHSYLPLARTEAMRLLAGISVHQQSRRLLIRSTLVDDVLSSDLPAGSECHTVKFLHRLALPPFTTILFDKKLLIPKLLLLLKPHHIPTRLDVLRILCVLAKCSCTIRLVMVCHHQRAMRRLVFALKQQELRSLALEASLLLIDRATGHRMMEIHGFLPAVLGRGCDDVSFVLVVAQLLQKLAMYVEASDRKFPLFVRALIILSSSPEAAVRLCIIQALLNQSQIASSAFYIMRTPEIFNLIILHFCRTTTDPVVRKVATETLIRLGSFPLNWTLLLSHPSALSVVVENLMLMKTDMQQKTSNNESYRLGIQLILCLVNLDRARSRIANEFNLTYCLASFAVSNDDDACLKHAALCGLLVLTPFL